MKILYYGYPSSAGKAPHQEMAALHLSRMGHSVDHVCWGGKKGDHSSSSENLTYLPQQKKGILSAVQLLLFLFRTVWRNKNGYEVIYVQGAQQTPFVFWLPLFARRIRIIYHTQDYLEPRRHRFYELFEKWFARRVHYVISNEMNRGRFMKSYYGLSHMPVILRTGLPIWWEMPTRSEESRSLVIEESGVSDPDTAVLILAGGPYRGDRMSPQLLEAFALLPDRYVLVFNGPAMAQGKECRKACEMHMKQLNLSNRVVFRAGLTFEELLRLYSIGDIGMLLYPNDGIGHYYQCPGRFSEYIRNGLSLVASNFQGLELLLLKYNLGAVCNADDPASIAEAIRLVGPNASEQRNRIRQLAENEFVYESEAGVLNELIQGTYKQFKPSVIT
ncbi:hypothetical protein P4E94_02440 [Pontiellaceae bacterium B12219]|nr:hypothetical protein [Pontiellaceae bacterium B12219]